MKTFYIRLHQILKDKVWGGEVSPVRTSLIRVTRNCLMRSQWEWVGGGAWTERDHEHYRRCYPIAERADE